MFTVLLNRIDLVKGLLVQLTRFFWRQWRPGSTVEAVPRASSVPQEYIKKKFTVFAVLNWTINIIYRKTTQYTECVLIKSSRVFLWISTTCLLRLDLWENLRPQKPQPNFGVTPHSNFECLCRLPLCMYVLPHLLHA